MNTRVTRKPERRRQKNEIPLNQRWSGWEHRRHGMEWLWAKRHCRSGFKSNPSKHTGYRKAREANIEQRNPMCPNPQVHPWDGDFSSTIHRPWLWKVKTCVSALFSNVEESVVPHAPSVVHGGFNHKASCEDAECANNDDVLHIGAEFGATRFHDGDSSKKTC